MKTVIYQCVRKFSETYGIFLQSRKKSLHRALIHMTMKNNTNNDKKVYIAVSYTSTTRTYVLEL